MITEFAASLLAPQATYAPWDNFWYNPPNSGPTLAGPYGGPDQALHVSAFFNGIRILAETVAQPPLILYERLADEEKEVAKNSALYSVLHDQPNPYQTSYEFRNLQTYNMLLGGNAYSLILGGSRSAVEELRPLIPAHMRPKRLASYRIGYMYTDDQGRQVPYAQDEIFHVRAFPLTPDGVMGQSLLTFARETIGMAQASEAYGARLYSTDAKQRGNYSVPSFLNKTQVEELRQTINDSNGLMILQGGATWVQTGMTAQDAEFLLNRKFEVIEVARWLNIAPHLLKDLDRATYSNIEQQSLEFLQYTMMPYFINWEQAILRDLIIQKSRFFAEFLVDGLVRADIKTRYEAYGTGINTGFMTRNQARTKENWNRIEGLDAPLIDQNKALVDKSGNIVPINKPDTPANPRAPLNGAAAHYQELLFGNANQVMRKEAKALGKAWEKDKRDSEKLVEWAEKFFADHAHFVADVMKLDENRALKFVNDRRERFILSVKDKCPHEHIHETEKYGPGQLIAFLNNGHGETHDGEKGSSAS